MGDTISSATWSLSLASLMNASLEPTQNVKKSLYELNALILCLKLLATIPNNTSNGSLRSKLPEEIWVRTAGLISRIVTYPPALTVLTSPKGTGNMDYPGLMKKALENTSSLPEKEHLIRTLAVCLSQINVQTHNDFYLKWMDEKIVSLMCSLLPEPVREKTSNQKRGLITATTVCLPPLAYILDEEDDDELKENQGKRRPRELIS